MKNKCKCGAEITWGTQCYDCSLKEDRIVLGIIIGIFAFVIALIFGVRIILANVVFDDWRCAFSECRIIKN